MIAFSAPLQESSDVVFAVEVPELGTKLQKKARRGFRPKNAHAWGRFEIARSQAIIRWTVSRFDSRFLLERGGADPSLCERSAAVIGCGSVGSHLAALLAESGFGRLLLVDKEMLVGGNVHRHALGTAEVGRMKAVALAELLESRFPHAEFAGEARGIQELLSEDPARVAEGDLVLIALGHETLERRLDRYFALPRSVSRRLHVWLEPFGLGGHVLSVGPAQGCLSCLFKQDERYGLVNMASLVAPGQDFSRTLAGCAGTFTPFGAIDAHQAAVEGAREAKIAIGGGSPRLVSWAGDVEGFLSRGFKLSRRGEVLHEERRVERTDFAQPGCETCRTRAS